MIQRKLIKSAIIILFTYLLIIIPFSFAKTTYKVKGTDNLSRISQKFYKNSGLTKQQIFIGILAENPSAFSFGNINYLKGGQSLILPSVDNLLAMEAVDAEKLVARHNHNAKKRKKIKMSPPFKNYSPSINNASNETKEIAVISEKQQKVSKQLKELDSETELLRIRLEQLAADKKAMDAEIQQLDSLLKE